ncbi:MAG: septation ring formation regulator EzrA [Pirellulales bacterium]|nr:septation ring formation regulator EzrA [Pirellulales bacterium]
MRFLLLFVASLVTTNTLFAAPFSISPRWTDHRRNLSSHEGGWEEHRDYEKPAKPEPEFSGFDDWKDRAGGFFGAHNGEEVYENFEDEFDDFMQQFEQLMENDPDYLESEEFLDLVDQFEEFTDQYSAFVDRQDGSIERVDDLIEASGDAAERYDQWLEKIEEHDKISEERLETIQERLTDAQERAAERIDELNEKKSELEENLESYITFQDEIESYLEEIQNPLEETITQEIADPEISTVLETNTDDVVTVTSDSISVATTAETQIVAAESTSATEVLFESGTEVSAVLGGGAATVGGADVTFDDQAGGVFSADFFHAATQDDLLASIGQTAFDDINFLTVGDVVQGWELHFEGEFDGYAHVVLGYDDSLLPAGFDQSTLVLMHFDSEKGLWEIPEDFWVDTVANQFSFKVTSFSPFVVSTSESVSPNPEPSTALLALISLPFWVRRPRHLERVRDKCSGIRSGGNS